MATKEKKNIMVTCQGTMEHKGLSFKKVKRKNRVDNGGETEANLCNNKVMIMILFCKELMDSDAGGDDGRMYRLICITITIIFNIIIITTNSVVRSLNSYTSDQMIEF